MYTHIRVQYIYVTPSGSPEAEPATALEPSLPSPRPPRVIGRP